MKKYLIEHICHFVIICLLIVILIVIILFANVWCNTMYFGKNFADIIKTFIKRLNCAELE